MISTGGFLVKEGYNEFAPEYTGQFFAFDMDKKRIFDVVVPQKKMQNKNIYRVQLETYNTRPRRDHGAPGGLLVFLFLALSCFLVYWFWEPTAQITMVISPERAQKEIEIKAIKNTSTTDLNNRTIALYQLSDQYTLTQDFPATQAEINDKAKGTIRIFNETDSTKTFVTGTQFLADSNLMFSITQRVIVPAATSDGGKLVPGTLDITAEAAKPGVEYNIGPSVFSIPKLKTTSYFSKIYAKSFTNMAGGFVGTGLKATPEDITQADDFMSREIFKKAKDTIVQKYSEHKILDTTFEQRVMATSSKLDPNSKEKMFTYEIRVETIALATKKNDLEFLAKKALEGELKQGQIIAEKLFNYKIISENADTQKGQAWIRVEGAAPYYYPPNFELIKTEIAGKPLSQVQGIIEPMYPGKVSEIRVNLNPPIKDKLPQDIQKITTVLQGVD